MRSTASRSAGPRTDLDSRIILSQVQALAGSGAMGHQVLRDPLSPPPSARRRQTPDYVALRSCHKNFIQRKTGPAQSLGMLAWSPKPAPKNTLPALAPVEHAAREGEVPPSRQRIPENQLTTRAQDAAQAGKECRIFPRCHDIADGKHESDVEGLAGHLRQIRPNEAAKTQPAAPEVVEGLILT